MKLENALPLAGRVLLAAIFILSGVGKLAAHQATFGYINAVGLPFPELAYVGSVVVELGGGILLLVGYQTRFAAAALTLFTLATAVLFHGALGNQEQFVHFLKNVAIAGGLLQVVAFGAGALSLDARPRIATNQA